MAAGKEIKRLRGKDVTASKAAKFIGVGVDRLRKWEERDSNPNDTGDIAKVEAYFGVKLDGLPMLKSFDFVEKRAANGLHEGHKSAGYVPADQVIADLRKDKEWLQGILATSLVSIVEGQQQSGIQIKALSWFSALAAAGGDEKKAQESILAINNRIASYEGIGGEGGSLSKDDIKSSDDKRRQRQ